VTRSRKPTRACRIDDVIRAHARAADKDRSVQPPEALVVRELRCARARAAIKAAIRNGALRRGARGLYVPAGVDPGARYIFRKGARGQLARSRR